MDKRSVYTGVTILCTLINYLGQRKLRMRDLKGEEGGVVADLKVEQCRNNRADCLHSNTSADILELT